MQIRLKTSIGGTPSHCIGDVLEVAEIVGRAWIADGIAEALHAESEPEAATVAVPEAAMRKRARAR